MKLVVWLSLFSGVTLLFGQFNHKPESASRFTELSREDRERLDLQRTLIAETLKRRYGAARLTKTKEDLPALQKLLDEKAFKKSQTYELQSLGVTFGDILASELPLRWVMITDEFGIDPTLRFRDTSVNINALTMISKRVEKNEHVNLVELLENTREALSRAERELP